MASIRKHRTKWQVQVRRTGLPALSKSFINRKDAEIWARQKELQIDRRELPKDPKQLERITLAQLVIRYRETITPHKRAAAFETIILNAFLRHSICNKKISDLTVQDFAAYRDERLRHVKASSLKRMLAPTLLTTPITVSFGYASHDAH